MSTIEIESIQPYNTDRVEANRPITTLYPTTHIDLHECARAVSSIRIERENAWRFVPAHDELTYPTISGKLEEGFIKIFDNLVLE